MILRRAVLSLLLTCVLAGCATTDRYYDRVIAYNEETDSAYDSMLLLNIIRSSYRMPTQFMDVSNIVGSNAATASATFNGSTSPTGSAAAGLSYSSTFTAPVLNTKEFYQGILAPISPDILNYYFQTSRPLELVFDLMFDRITVKATDGECGRRASLGKCVADFTNDPRNPQSFALFQTMMKYLLMNGFSTERVSIKKPKESLSGEKVNITISSTTDATDPKPSGSDTKAVRFCFHPGSVESAAILSRTLLCDNYANKTVDKKQVIDIENSLKLKLSRKLADTMHSVNQASARSDDDGEQTLDFDAIIENFKDRDVQLTLRLRSTSGAVEYLGRVVQSQREGKFDPVMIRNSEEDGTDYAPCNATKMQTECAPLFVVDGDGEAAAFGVSYRGARYFIPATSTKNGNSTYTLGILKQLIGLNTSSKSSPVPAILTGIPTL